MLLYGREDLAVWKLMCSFAAVEQWRLATLHIEIKHESVSTDFSLVKVWKTYQRWEDSGRYSRVRGNTGVGVVTLSNHQGISRRLTSRKISEQPSRFLHLWPIMFSLTGLWTKVNLIQWRFNNQSKNMMKQLPKSRMLKFAALLAILILLSLPAKALADSFTIGSLNYTTSVSYTHLTLPTT